VEYDIPCHGPAGHNNRPRYHAREAHACAESGPWWSSFIQFNTLKHFSWVGLILVFLPCHTDITIERISVGNCIRKCDLRKRRMWPRRKHDRHARDTIASPVSQGSMRPPNCPFSRRNARTHYAPLTPRSIAVRAIAPPPLPRRSACAYHLCRAVVSQCPKDSYHIECMNFIIKNKAPGHDPRGEFHRRGDERTDAH